MVVRAGVVETLKNIKKKTGAELCQAQAQLG
jgi:hypothetical protein